MYSRYIITYLCHCSVHWGQALVFSADRKIPTQGYNVSLSVENEDGFLWHFIWVFIHCLPVHPFTGIKEYDCIHYTVVRVFSDVLAAFLYFDICH